jgi:hypothetical protein
LNNCPSKRLGFWTPAEDFISRYPVLHFVLKSAILRLFSF